MAFLIERTWHNGYRCSCCDRTRKSSEWTDSLEEALEGLPKEFPIEEDHGGHIAYKVTDGATQATVVESRIGWPINHQRGDAYKYTKWSLYINEEFVPDKGCFTTQMIEGRNFHDSDEEAKPLHLVDKTWSQVNDELRDKAKQAEIRKAEAAKAEAERKLAHLRAS